MEFEILQAHVEEVSHLAGRNALVSCVCDGSQLSSAAKLAAVAGWPENPVPAAAAAAIHLRRPGF